MLFTDLVNTKDIYYFFIIIVRIQSPLPVNVRRSRNITCGRRKKERGKEEKRSLFPFLPVPYSFKCYLKFDFFSQTHALVYIAFIRWTAFNLLDL